MLEIMKDQPFVKVLFAIVYLGAGVIITLVHIPFYLILRPLNIKLYRKVNYYLTYALYCQVTFLIEWWSNAEYDLYADPEVVKKYIGKEHAYVIVNHGRDIEAFIPWVIGDHFGFLGNFRGIVKKVLSYAPVYGWCMYMQENVFLQRNWNKDKERFGEQLRNLMEYEDPMWLGILPEGTRITPEKLESSKKVSREKGLPELQNVLLPRTRGFVAGVNIFREKVPAVYDITVVIHKDYEDNACFSELIKGRPLKFKVMLKRHPMSELPENEEELAMWLHKRYQEKDKLVQNVWNSEEFEPKEGSLSTEEMKEGHKNFQYVPIPRPWSSALNIAFWAVIIIGYFLCYLVTTVMNGNYVQLLIASVLMQAASIGLEKVMDLTRTSKASSYGQQESPPKSS